MLLLPTLLALIATSMNRDLSAPAVLETPTRVRFGVLGFACALSMITYLDRVCFGTVAPFIQGEFQLSDKQLGLLFAAFALAYAIFEVPSGWLGDVFGPRKTLIRIVLWWSLFTALTGAIFPVASWPSFAFLAMLAVRFLFGMGEAGAYPNIARAFHSWFPFVERGTAQGTVWMSGRFMGGATPLVVTALFMETVTASGGEPFGVCCFGAGSRTARKRSPPLTRPNWTSSTAKKRYTNPRIGRSPGAGCSPA